MGKTSLLRRFKQECPLEIRYVPFECKGVVSIASFLSQVVVDLGREQFPSFITKVRVFVQGGVDFSENDIAAEKTISIAINANVDLATQGYRLEELQEAFFNDLSKLQYQTVVALDTYQLANDDLRDWIESKWLRAVERQLKNVVTVIAGQSVPDSNNVVWGDECAHFTLAPIQEVDAWCRFCPSLPKDAIKGLVIVGKGHPKDIEEMLLLAEKASW